MYGGSSGSQGMLLYKKTKTENRAVYGYYEQEKIHLHEGTYEDMLKIKREKEKAFKLERSHLGKYMAILFAADLFFVIFMFVKTDILGGISALIFATGTYVPLLIIVYSHINEYLSASLHQQLCRFHGCEHKAVTWLTYCREKEALTVENLMKMKMYDAECGTAYSGYFLVFFTITSLVVFHLFEIGLLKALGILLLTIVLLLVNIFNPINPFLLLQRAVVKTPTEKEYTLAIAVMEKLMSSPNLKTD